METTDDMLEIRSASRRGRKTKTGVGKPGASLLLRLQVGSPVKAATSSVIVKLGGFTAINPPEQRPSSLETSMTGMVKLEINIAELKLAQCEIKHAFKSKNGRVSPEIQWPEVGRQTD